MATPLRHLRLGRFVYTCTLFVVWIHLSGWAVGSWIGRSLSRFRGRPATAGYEIIHGHQSAHAPERPRSSRRHAKGSSDKDYESLYRHLLHLRDIYSTIYVSSEDITSQKEENEAGLSAVRSFLPPKLQRIITQTSPEGESPGDAGCPDHCAVLPCRRPTPMNSAVRRTTANFTSQKSSHWWVVGDPDGKVYDFEMIITYVREPDNRCTFNGFVEKIERFMRMCQIFRVGSLSEVEDRFSILVPRDILTSPVQDYQLPYAGGAFLNFIVLYTQTVPSIFGFASRVQQEGRLSAKKSMLAEAARLSLALQILKILARLALRGVVLRNFDMSSLKVAASGRVLVDAYAEPEKEDLGVTHVSSGHASTSGGHGRGRPIDRHSNARTTTLVLAYLWCPQAVRRLYLSSVQPTRNKLLEALQDSDCVPVPEAILGIIQNVWEKNMDAGEIIFTKSYMDLYALLRDLRSEEGADASR